LPGHETESVPLIGWAGIQNGELLAKAAEAGFDVLVTMDSNMVYQPSVRFHIFCPAASRDRLRLTSPHLC
jgi:hypothetical protein